MTKMYPPGISRLTEAQWSFLKDKRAGIAKVLLASAAVVCALGAAPRVFAVGVEVEAGAAGAMIPLEEMTPAHAEARPLAGSDTAVAAVGVKGAAEDKGGAQELPNAPVPNVDMASYAPAQGMAFGYPAMSANFVNGVGAGAAGAAFVNAPDSGVTLKDCPYDTTHARVCRVHWGQLTIEGSLYLAFQNAGNLYTGYWYRYETMHGKWWDRYVNSVEGWRWNVWDDNNPVLDDYVGHPMMGAITNAIWTQNDPKGMTLEYSNTWPYWRSKLRATAFSTFFSFEWKLGPIGEASVGHNGDHYFGDNHSVTNETGWVELVTTPVGGLGWTVAEDAIDEKVIRKLEDKSRNPLLLLTYQFLNPARGTANILRFRPPWYRDSRVVKANSFWSDPGDGTSPGAVTGSTANAIRLAPTGQGVVDYTTHRPVRLVEVGGPGYDLPGGKHEFGAWWGLSLISGHIWGYAGDVKYMPIDVRYSYQLWLHDKWAFRYSPEVTALAMIDWPTPQNKSVYEKRTRAYGSGVSPVGFQWDFYPRSRVQPFFSGDGGFLYFDQRVLSPEGSKFMYTVDYGAGINIFRKKRQAVTIGYRYQHLSNADISHHNPGTDANTFYVGVSRFRTKGSD